MNFQLWLESSYRELFDSAVQAFPNTRKRQHVIHEININNIRYTPFLGLNTLLVRAIAESNNGNNYNTTILFKKVKYGKGNTKIYDEINQNHILEKLNKYR